MAIASRLTNTGTLLVNGSFDEVTNAGNTSFATRTDSTGTVYTTNSATGFDEVSYSANGTTGAYSYKNGVDTTTNLFLYTQQLDNANWIKQGTTVTADQAIAPDGSLTADLVTATSTYPTVTTTPGRGTLVFSITSGQVYTVSAYVKYINQQKCVIVNEAGVPTGYVVFDILNGTVANTSAGNSSATGTITAVGNGWYRITATYTIPATSTAWNPQPVRIGNYDGTDYNGSQMYAWGLQLELSASATNYVGMLGTGVNLNNFARRDVTTGVEFVAGEFDEVTWNPPIVSSGLLYNLDASVPGSYSGTGTTWIDLTGNGGNSGSTTNFPFSTTGVNSSFFFNGISTLSLSNPSGYITSYADAFSAEVWLYIPSSSTWDTTGSGGVYSRGSFAGSHGLIVGTTNNTVGIFVRGQTLGFGTSRFATITRDAWYHIVGTWSGSGTAVLSIYSNGVLAGTTSGVTNTDDPPDTGVWRLGGSSTTGFSGAYPLAGVPMSIATARLYNTSLSAADVKQNYNALCYRYGLATI